MQKPFFIILVLGIFILSALGIVQTSLAKEQSPSQTESALQQPNGHGIIGVSIVVPRKSQKGQWYVTESGYLAAVEEALLDRAIFWAGMGDEEEFMRFIGSTDLVFPLKAGLRVFVEKFSFSGKVRIRPEGSNISVWTIREAIRSEFPGEGT